MCGGGGGGSLPSSASYGASLHSMIAAAGRWLDERIDPLERQGQPLSEMPGLCGMPRGSCGGGSSGDEVGLGGGWFGGAADAPAAESAVAALQLQLEVLERALPPPPLDDL
mmetsp:Transcript_66778/g.176163  ORF Transcript_66778/g.176163 Transcript_66778/m.176163 type:complete len:111 (-) Transcript_66778:70-402(-)